MIKIEEKIGHYSFIGGVIIAVVLGLASSYLGASPVPWLILLLILLGVILSTLNSLPYFLNNFKSAKKIVLEHKQLKSLIDNSLVIYVGSTATIILSKYFFDMVTLIELIKFSYNVFFVVFITFLIIYIIMIYSFILLYFLKNSLE